MHGRRVGTLGAFGFDVLRQTGLKKGLVEHRPSSGRDRHRYARHTGGGARVVRPQHVPGCDAGVGLMAGMVAGCTSSRDYRAARGHMTARYL